MSVMFRDRTNPVRAEVTSLDTNDDASREAAALPAQAVIERVNAILGYDIFESSLMAEGYVELGSEMLSISESTLAAQAEALPE